MASAVERTLLVRIKPRAHTASLEALSDGTWVARVRAAPVDGNANDALLSLVADHFHCPKSCVHIIAGVRSRVKKIALTSRG